eukprot:CAMPEP_0115169730 /NCGR_PEP_ID=MMETSP0270-20121206/1420_1 /TAXON_ID=71861 /ORGANISM="Scrippsiella trochoidea, Strain CCMP3099" /LENGTH=159 /DNA_ID=CAMNT_0002582439 /DNA_START=182 /DNA_END=658 /DNA_ORIENTATION=+
MALTKDVRILANHSKGVLRVYPNHLESSSVVSKIKSNSELSSLLLIEEGLDVVEEHPVKVVLERVLIRQDVYPFEDSQLVICNDHIGLAFNVLPSFLRLTTADYELDAIHAVYAQPGHKSALFLECLAHTSLRVRCGLHEMYPHVPQRRHSSKGKRRGT